MSLKRPHESQEEETQPKKKAKTAYHVRDADLRRANFKVSLADAEPEVAALWCQKQNGNVTPHDVGPNSNLHATFICVDSKCPNGCDHTHDMIIARKVKYKKCSWCTGKNRRCCSSQSLAGHPYFIANLAIQWDREKNGDPANYSPFSMKHVWWKCTVSHGSDCEHVWRAQISARMVGNGCPFCSENSSAVCCVEVSLANPQYAHIAELFDFEKNDFTPDQIRAHAHRYAHWKCEQGHEFQSMVFNRVNKDITSCNLCGRSPAEKAMEAALISLHLQFKPHYRLPNNQVLDFAVFLNEQMLAIETDGKRWHFDESFRGFVCNKQRDKRKNQWCVENHVPLLRMGYSVKFEHYVAEVQDFLDRVQSEPTKTVLRFIGKEYENHFN